MLRDDPNESSAVYLLSSDDKCAVCGTNFSEIFSDVSSHLWRRLSITCRATKRMVCRYRTNLGDFRHRRTLGIYKRTWKRAKIAKRNSAKCKWIFHQLAAKNFNVNVVQGSTASVIRYSIGKKKVILFLHLTGQNRGLSGLKNIWPVIMTGDQLSVILSLALHFSRIFPHASEILIYPNDAHHRSCLESSQPIF